MAKKSKTQRAKASAARAARREQARAAEAASENQKSAESAAATETPKKRFFKKAETETSSANSSKQVKTPSKSTEKKVEKKAEKKSAPKKRRFGFLKDVRAELKRVTWPTRQDVLRWSVVVVVALVFFGVYVAILDNAIITPVLIGISSLGA